MRKIRNTISGPVLDPVNALLNGGKISPVMHPVVVKIGKPTVCFTPVRIKHALQKVFAVFDSHKRKRWFYHFPVFLDNDLGGFQAGRGTDKCPPLIINGQ